MDGWMGGWVEREIKRKSEREGYEDKVEKVEVAGCGRMQNSVNEYTNCMQLEKKTHHIK